MVAMITALCSGALAKTVSMATAGCRSASTISTLPKGQTNSGTPKAKPHTSAARANRKNASTEMRATLLSNILNIDYNELASIELPKQ